MVKVLVVFIVALFTLTATSAEQSCGSVAKDIIVKDSEASASFWGNLRNREGSISYESNALFTAAKDEADKLIRPDNFCPKGCQVSKRAVLFFRSAPNKFLSDYDDSKYCEALLESTTRTPLTYVTTALTSIDELNSWISDLSQGKGDSGTDLYEKCDKSCSPRFEYTIARRGEVAGQYLVKASVTCGPARDKDDNMYNLDAFFRWNCEEL